jgi:phosphatidylcholine synthase
MDTEMLRVLNLPLRKREKTEKRERSRRRDLKRAASPAAPPGPLTRALAWCVHLYTALGLALAAVIAVLLVQGGPGAFRWSFVLMAVATFIDGTDGTLARKVRIKEVIPNFDGRKLDDITDFLTYTFLPLLLIWRASLLPPGTEWCLVLPLLASAYGFCQCAAKTDDGYFLGFPSLWNIVAFYLYVLQVPGWTALAVVLALAALTFVPSRYLYPSQPGRLNALHNVLAAGWAGMLAWVLLGLPAHEVLRAAGGGGAVRSVARASLFYPAFYMGASWVVTLRLWLRGH